MMNYQYSWFMPTNEPWRNWNRISCSATLVNLQVYVVIIDQSKFNNGQWATGVKSRCTLSLVTDTHLQCINKIIEGEINFDLYNSLL